MVLELLAASGVSRISDEDLYSQCNFQWLALIVMGMGFVITLAQYVGEPIQCWCPAEFPDSQCNYTKALCWVKQNYYKHHDQPIEADPDDRYDITVSYYPWIPWLLFSMAVVLNIPHIMWLAFSKSSGLNLHKIVAMANTHDNIPTVANCLRMWLVKSGPMHNNLVDRFKENLAPFGLFWLGRHNKSYFSGLIILVKMAYLAVSVLLFLGLNAFIDAGFSAYGFEVLKYIFNGTPMNAARFPRQTMCDLKVRQMANVLQYSIQCILPINIYNEKIFIFLWFSLPLLIALNAYSLIMWVCKLILPHWRRAFVKKYVVIMHRLLDECTQSPPRQDGKDELLANGNAAEPRIESTLDSPIGRDGRRDNWPHRRLGLSNEAADDSQNDYDSTTKEKRKDIRQITTKMLNKLGHDGVAVFQTLHHSVGIVTANEIFQELYEQITNSDL